MGREDSSGSVDTISDVFDAVLEETEGHSQVELGRLISAFDERSYGPLLLLPGILSVSPMGAIPGMSIVTGALIVLIAGQALVGRPQPWLPKRLLNYEFSRKRLENGIQKSRPIIQRIERLITSRLDFMHTTVVFRIGAAVCLALAASYFPLSLVPMGVAVPGTTIILFSLGWTARDGVLVIAALALSLATPAVCLYAWPF